MRTQMENIKRRTNEKTNSSWQSFRSNGNYANWFPSLEMKRQFFLLFFSVAGERNHNVKKSSVAGFRFHLFVCLSSGLLILKRRERQNMGWEETISGETYIKWLWELWQPALRQICAIQSFSEPIFIR